jgi:KUP system potassium uptake protein
LRESFESRAHELAVVEPNVLGVLSLTFWSLMIVITIKYLIFVMRADNQGEGGILALTSLVAPKGASARGARVVLVLIGLFGTALSTATASSRPPSRCSRPSREPKSRPRVSNHGSSRLDRDSDRAVHDPAQGHCHHSAGCSEPIMVIWFFTIAILGLPHIIDHPEIIKALNPVYGIRFFRHNGLPWLLVARLDLPRCDRW